MENLSVLLLWFVSLALAFLIGLELGRWHLRIARFLAAIRQDIRHKEIEEKAQRDATPGVVKPKRTGTPIDLEEVTGPVLPMSPRQVALENAREQNGR